MRVALIALWLVLSVTPADVSAQVFKCKEADGTLTYSQTPCATEDVAVVKIADAESEPLECGYANKFAFATARTMQGGVPASEIFRTYGGLDALSKGSLGVINYVYSFRTADDVSAERIAGLAEAKCEARSFGDVTCETLPRAFVESIGGCDDEEGNMGVPAAAATVGSAGGQQTIAPSSGRGHRVTTTAPANSNGNKELTEQCKKRYRDQIDAIDAEMRRGYTSEKGEVYRERLRGLTEKLRAC